VRLACERHLRDLGREGREGFAYQWQPERAQHAIDFFEQFLLLGEGQPFRLQPWQKFIVGSLHGWRQLDGYRRFRTAYVEVGKGAGKTPMAGGLALYALIADGEEQAQCFCAATTREQASLAFRDAKRMAEANPDLAAVLEITEHNIALPERYSFLRAVSSERRGLDGKRVHFADIDELHEHPSPIVVDKMRAGTKGRKQALIFEITNSGYDRQSVCWQHHEYSLKILDGTLDNETWFAYVCQLDVCADCLRAGHMTPVQGCQKCDRWDVEGPHWQKTNPNLGVSITAQYLREQVQEAIGMPSKANIVRRLNFCEWTEGVERWLPMDMWQDCVSTEADPDSLAGQPCYAGLDLASTKDIAALVLVFPRDDGGYAVLPHFWVPADGARKRAEVDRVDYLRWIESGHLKATEGNVIDYDVIREDIRELAERYEIQSIAYDRWSAVQLVTQLTSDGAACVPVGQGFASLSAPAKELEKCIMGRTLHHGDHPVLTWMAGNVCAEHDAAGNIKPSKRKSSEKIDGIMALCMALGEAARHTEGEGESVYDTRGLEWVEV
jgi:phage terminase large subunit-like protein